MSTLVVVERDRVGLEGHDGETDLLVVHAENGLLTTRILGQRSEKSDLSDSQD